jgi:8-amino-7-oxononanoate synthase
MVLFLRAFPSVQAGDPLAAILPMLAEQRLHVREPLAWIGRELADLSQQDLLRRRSSHTGPQQARIVIDGREVVNFSSNDYLGLAADPRLTAAAQQAAQQEGWGAGASPLVSGYSASHQRLEERLAAFEGTEAALLFPSGFAANQGTIAALVGRDDAVFADALNHASLIDGCRLSRAAVHVYPHCDCQRLAEMLKGAAGCRRRLIVTDSLFSMDGDVAPLAELADLAEQFDAMLLIDEAHATGVFGERGRGLAEELGVEDRVHVRIGTLSKALGSAGGFVTGSRTLVEWLVNRARPYIFSTAQPPGVSAAAIAALAIVEQEPERRTALLATSAAVREALRSQGWNIGRSESQVIPLIVGPATSALELSARLREQGFLVPAIRPPSVPAGQSRLRISLTAGHTPEMVDALLAALARVG